ncbi:GNAT family N-acetyltransferase [Thalassotalea profundi]|uniref:N-acetyltransferase domain-containing protein n=1 Tax=Thalassotalea profundi TaxID=2036687 RepID=A0ABQ3J3V7_9GAMM|nr:GNAT family N-acetyltransferase [Thalassotalea profundi]GHE98014.1 hypothetical protein GCM10011501_29420 [Thalassotalea profundi]
MTLHIITAGKNDKKRILNFYKQQHYSARFLGLDHTYFIKEGELIIACVIVSYITKNNPQGFLHALVVDKKYMGRKLASKLIHHCIRQHPILICFAGQSLTPLYLKNKFTKGNINTLSNELLLRFNVYFNKDKQLVIFSHILQ